MYSTITAIQSEVIEALQEDGIEAEVRNVFKNGTTLYGIMAKCGSMSPTIYVNENTYVVEAVEALKQAIVDAPDFGDSVLSALDFDNVTVYVTNGEVDGVITKQLLGGISYGVSIPIKGYESGYVKLTNDISEKIGVSADDLFTRASANLHQSAKIENLSSVFARLLGTAHEEESESPMYVALTTDDEFGGALLTDTELLESFRKEHGDFWIIPSSIHELIFVPCKVSDGVRLKPMISEVNEGCVSPEERLSDNLFKFDKNGLTVFEA